MELKLSDMRKIALGGVDTITTAIALSLKRSGFKGAIYGVDNSSVVTQAWNNGCVTDGGTDWHEALRHCRLVVLSRNTPDPIERLTTILELAEPNTIILDATAVKGHEEAAMESSGRKDVHYVGFHLVNEPKHETTENKPSHFFFDGKAIVLTPHVRADYPAYKVMEAVLQSVGATVIAMSPQAFHERLAMLDFVPDLLEFLELEAVLASTSAEKISAEYLGSRLHDRLKRLAGLHETSWHESLLGTRTHVDSLLANIQLSIQTLREDLLNATFKERVTAVLAKGDYLQKQAIDANRDEIIVMTSGDPKVMERIAKLLAESRVVVSKLELMQGKTDGAYKIRLDSEANRNKAASLLKAAGIKVEFKD